ncbi:MAG: hypothetical protein AB1696_15905 [Planctomycetota bacterium]
MSEQVSNIPIIPKIPRWFHAFCGWVAAFFGIGRMDARLKALEKDNAELRELLSRRANEIADCRNEMARLREATLTSKETSQSLTARLEAKGHEIEVFGPVIQDRHPGGKTFYYCTACWADGKQQPFTCTYETVKGAGDWRASCKKCETSYDWPDGVPTPKGNQDRGGIPKQRRPHGEHHAELDDYINPRG